jgi:hypothetical protein
MKIYYSSNSIYYQIWYKGISFDFNNADDGLCMVICNFLRDVNIMKFREIDSIPLNYKSVFVFKTKQELIDKYTEYIL